MASAFPSSMHCRSGSRWRSRAGRHALPPGFCARAAARAASRLWARRPTGAARRCAFFPMRRFSARMRVFRPCPPVPHGALQGLSCLAGSKSVGIARPTLVAGMQTPPEAVFRFPGGLKDYLAQDIEGRETVVDSFPLSARRTVKAAMARWNGPLSGSQAMTASSHSYCNTIPTADGGTHEAGLRLALMRGLKDHAERIGQTKRIASSDHRRCYDQLRRIALGVHPRAGISGPEQGPSDDGGGDPHRRDDFARRFRSLAGGLARRRPFG